MRYTGTEWVVRMSEKGNKAREIPLRHDLEGFLFAYLDSANLRPQPSDNALFRSALGRSDDLTKRPITGADVCRLVK